MLLKILSTLLFLSSSTSMIIGLAFAVLVGSIGINAGGINSVVFVILSQPNESHELIANKQKAAITSELIALNRKQDKVLIAPADFSDVLGYWIVMPLFEKLVKFPDVSWVVFSEERTKLDVTLLLEVLSSYDHTKYFLIGHGLKDKEPTIIHHFDSTDSDDALVYPDFSAGFAISFSALKRGAEKWNQIEDLGFSIDPKYELAKFFLKELDGVKLINDSRFCLLDRSSKCATWVEDDFSFCKFPIDNKNVVFGVKTCEKYHNDRVNVLKNTWGKEAENILFFSDVEDSTIPTVNLKVPNVNSGHCEKTMSIIRFFSNSSDFNMKWIVIVDDDTLISVTRLLELLSCYDSSNHVALGERYGYHLVRGRGYDYITGGGGMVFSVATIKRLADYCQCPSSSSPDDMIIGICLKNINIPIIHSMGFHQARPEDYSLKFLKHHKSVSFHKHWMTDPYKVYETWLRVLKHQHSEL